MGKAINLTVDEDLKYRSDSFIKNAKSTMRLKTDLNSDVNSLEWLEIIENGTKYIIRVEERIKNNEIKDNKYT